MEKLTLTRQEIEATRKRFAELVKYANHDATPIDHAKAVALCDMALSTLAPSAPTEREKASAWRPISEAKKDGTWVQLGSNGESGNGTWVTQGRWNGERWVGETPDDGSPGYCPLHDGQPTHFQPLPPAPAAEKE